jgi:hypothetical protein
VNDEERRRRNRDLEDQIQARMKDTADKFSEFLTSATDGDGASGADEVSGATDAAERAAARERAVVDLLDGLDGVIALHRRPLPGTTSRIGHLVIAPSGVYVLEIRHHRGVVERRRGRLRVGGRDGAHLLESMRRRRDAVRRVLDDDSVPMVVELCLVDAEWPVLTSRLDFDGIRLTWPKALVKQLASDGPLTPDDVSRLALRLDAALPAS